MTEKHEPFMPEAESKYLRDAYQEARVILEYGSGGSTRMAASMPGKYIMSVESDRDWARELRHELIGSRSPVTILHVDVGKTGPWGRPLDETAWRRFHAYPNLVWDQKWFRHPDVVLIDGRFRTACFSTIFLRAERPVRVLFDDYGVRPLYHQVEQFLKPKAVVGRLAEFWVEPGQVKPKMISTIIAQFFKGSVHGTVEKDYQIDH